MLVRPELQAQLDVSIGDTLTIGEAPFTIRGVIDTEPGRRLGAFSLGPRVFVAGRPREDRPADLWQPGCPSAPGQGAGCDARRIDHDAAQRLLEPVRARPLLQGHGRRHRGGLRARRGLPEPGRTGDCDPRRHRRLERDAGLRPAEDPEHRGVEVRGRTHRRSCSSIYLAQVVVLGLAGSALGVLLAAAAMRRFLRRWPARPLRA